MNKWFIGLVVIGIYGGIFAVPPTVADELGNNRTENPCLEVANLQLVAEGELCAYLTYGKRCGWNGLGSYAYVNNRRNDKRVRATIRKTSESWVNDFTEVIPAGGRVDLGCTAEAYFPGYRYRLQVIGCEVL